MRTTGGLSVGPQLQGGCFTLPIADREWNQQQQTCNKIWTKLNKRRSKRHTWCLWPCACSWLTSSRWAGTHPACGDMPSLCWQSVNKCATDGTQEKENHTNQMIGAIRTIQVWPVPVWLSGRYELQHVFLCWVSSKIQSRSVRNSATSEFQTVEFLHRDTEFKMHDQDKNRVPSNNALTCHTYLLSQ